MHLSQKRLTTTPLLTRANFGQCLPPTRPITCLWPVWKRVPVSVWKQCSLNVSVSSISMPELPCSGDSWEPIANSLIARKAKLGMHLIAIREECFSNFSTEVTLTFWTLKLQLEIEIAVWTAWQQYQNFVRIHLNSACILQSHYATKHTTLKTLGKINTLGLPCHVYPPADYAYPTHLMIQLTAGKDLKDHLITLL